MIPQGIKTLRARIPDILENAETELTPEMRDLISMMSARIKDLTEKVEGLELKIKQGNKQNKMVAALEAIPGIGPPGFDSWRRKYLIYKHSA